MPGDVSVILPSFPEMLAQQSIYQERRTVSTVQINLGKRCNQACHHCHVEARPHRTENMHGETVMRLLALIRDAPAIRTVDITGDAPELNPYFRVLVRQLRALGKQVIERCNLTVLLEPGQEDAAMFLAEQQVQIIASLPCYLEDNVDQQRGRRVFRKSIAALLTLNNLAYGQPDSGLRLDLVYNPVGLHLPPAQEALEVDYKIYLYDQFGIVFNHLLTITNMPIKYYAQSLLKDSQMADYRQLLVDHFNPETVADLMYQDWISIGWDVQIYDCDFNQMLEIPLNCRKQTLWDISTLEVADSNIAVADHCFGCTAGAGSSCRGALV
jgi:radical SAM/Cys-rich protein